MPSVARPLATFKSGDVLPSSKELLGIEAPVFVTTRVVIAIPPEVTEMPVPPVARETTPEPFPCRGPLIVPAPP